MPEPSGRIGGDFDVGLEVATPHDISIMITLLPFDAPPHGPITGTIVVVAAGLAGGALYLVGSWRLGAPELTLAGRLIDRLRHGTGAGVGSGEVTPT